jgi:hypothetical protein
VGNAGENPNGGDGGDFGNGEKGQSDTHNQGGPQGDPNPN